MTRVLLVTMYGYQNTGIRLLSAVLRENGFEAPIIYMKRWANNDVHPPTLVEYDLLVQKVKSLSPDLIGIGFGTPYLKIVTEITKKLKDACPIPIVLGGVHPTISPEDCIELVDYVCRGEGEFPLLDLANAIKKGDDASQIKNLWVKTDSGIIKNEFRPLVQDLDSLPYEKTFDAPSYCIESDKVVDENPMFENAIYRIFATRGCPFNCAFCYNSQYRRIYSGLGKYFRSRSVENLLLEMEAAVKIHKGIRRMRFDDDSFVFPKSWIEEFVREYPKRIGLPFDILLNPNIYDAKQLRQLKSAGLIHVQVGVQSASESELAVDYNRTGSNEMILDLAQKLQGIGIEMTFDVILDNPLAKEKDKRAMLDFLLKLPHPFSLFLYSLTVFPKSEIAEKLLSVGLVTKEDIEGQATKSFRQFRLTLDYPRSKTDTFFAALITLTSKRFLPRALIRVLADSSFLQNHPTSLVYFAEFANGIKLLGLAIKMFARGELSIFKLREYASMRRRLIQ